jgi:hypothetical protein
MNHEDCTNLEFNNLPDVASTRFSALLRRDDAALNAAILDLVSLLEDPPEVTLAWNNLVDRRTSSCDPNSKS